MEKKNFVTLVMSVIGGLIFALGMCMCLVPEWDALTQGMVVGCAGTAELAATLMVRLKMEGKPLIVRLNIKTIGIVALGVCGTLVLGAGMCMTLLWGFALLVPGIVMGALGIMMLICLIPLCRGLR